MAKSPQDLLSVAEAAALLGVTDARIRQYIGEGRLQAQKVGHAYVIRRGDVQKFRPMKRGRPAKE